MGYSVGCAHQLLKIRFEFLEIISGENYVHGKGRALNFRIILWSYVLKRCQGLLEITLQAMRFSSPISSFPIVMLIFFPSSRISTPADLSQFRV